MILDEASLYKYICLHHIKRQHTHIYIYTHTKLQILIAICYIFHRNKEEEENVEFTHTKKNYSLQVALQSKKKQQKASFFLHFDFKVLLFHVFVLLYSL